MEENIYINHQRVFAAMDELRAGRDAVLTVDMTEYPHLYDGQMSGVDVPFTVVTGAYIDSLRKMAEFHLRRLIDFRKQNPVEGEEHIHRFDVWVSGVIK
ncbi:hypothetical protein FJZ28_00290 [Candidatus Peregrinibacteria bacterium]|nr:hypothetical protein [Candidatus Peregrinibacteria bacterium]